MPDDSELVAQAEELLAKVPLIDGHNDWPIAIRGHYDNKIERPGFEKGASLVGHVDIDRLVKGRSGGVFWSAYVDCPVPENDFSDETHLETLRVTLQQIDLIHRLVEKYSDDMEMVSSADEILPTFQRGKIACLIGVEGLHQIANSASVLRMYHRLGVRYVTLSHNSSNLYAESSRSKNPPFRGLSKEGVDMVREMNRIGMMIDLSHTSDATARAVLETSLAPVAFTHSNVYGLCSHRRNVPDSNLALLKKNQGIIMVSFVPYFTTDDPGQASVTDVVDHIMYIADMIGFDYIGVGSDYDGTEKLAHGLEDVSKFSALVVELLRRGVEQTNIEKILGLNVIRVLKEVEVVAKEKRGQLPVLEDNVKQIVSDEERARIRSLYPGAA